MAMARMRMIGGEAMRRLLFVACVWAGIGLPAPGHAQGVSGPLRKPAAPEYDVVALRVEFQPDTTRFSTGDGTFAGDPYQGIAPLVDPLPHDAAYFEAHLAFLEDYVGRVSDGKTVVRTHLIPEVVRLPRPMGAYAPVGPDADSDAERAKLARMVHEAWTLAGETIEFDMSRFTPGRTALLLFHAGVGRDVELSGTTLERTPEDLPSIFFDANMLRRLGADAATFHGFPIDHAMIIPRTETRPGTRDVFTGEKYLLELSINGLLAASFFNFLGAPDLFDTETGESAIGPFGLMDGLGIFAYGGLLPPEPMGWTKYFLGWTDPVDIAGNGPETVRLRAASLPESSDLVRVLVSDAEYFLVENRFRDPEGDGLRLRVFKDGETIEQHVPLGDSLFNSRTLQGFAGGVVTGADGYDWALPGGLDSEEKALNGGVLIWHVDERRLRAALGNRAVNAGERRAIDLEEADGPQDIGYPSGGLFGHGRHLGTPYDFFYEGNTYGPRDGPPLYQNRFGPDTYPASETNAGGPSFVVLESFSAPAADMSFVYRREAVGGAASLDAPALQALQGALGAAPAGSGLVATEDYLLLHGQDSVAVAAWGDAAPIGRVPSLAPPAVAPGNRMATFACGMDERAERCAIVVRTLGKPFDAPESVLEMPPDVGAGRPVSPVVHVSGPDGEAWHVLVESEGGVVHVQASASGVRSVSGGFGTAMGLAAWRGAGGTAPVAFESGGVEIGGTVWNYTIDAGADTGVPVVGRDPAGSMAALPLVETGELLLCAPGGVTRRIDVRAAAAATGRAGRGVLLRYPVLADMDGDHRLDVLAAMDSTVFAFTQSGALAAGFPVTFPARIASQPLVFRFEGDEAWTVLAAAADGYVYAARADGAPAGPFPLEVGEAVHATPLLLDDRLLAVSSTGFAKGWRLPSVPEIWWGTLYGSGARHSFVALEAPSDAPAPDGLIDARETYNWPNPIEGGVTHLRIRTFRDAEVRVTILDAGGARVGAVDMGNVLGGVPAETVWRADVQSGLYFARFTARAADGTRATRLIKMAVIR